MAQDETGRRGGASGGAGPQKADPAAARREAVEGKATVGAPTPPAGLDSKSPEAAQPPADPGRAPPPTPTPPQAETADESGGTEEMLRGARKPPR